MESKQVDILDILIILAKRKKFILTSLLIISVLIVTYSLLVQQTWSSTITFRPIISDDSASGLIGSVLDGNISSLLSGSSGTSDVESIIRSRSFLNKIINHFNLIEYFEIEEEDTYIVTELILRIMNKQVISIDENIETGFTALRITTYNRELSAEIANYVVQQYEDYNKNLRITKGKQERIFLSKRIDELNLELENSIEKMKELQVNYNIIELESQIPPIFNSYSNTVSEYIKIDIEKEYLSNVMNDPQAVKNLETKQNVILKQIRKFETGNDNLINYMVPLDSIPNISQQYLLLKIRSEILKQTYDTIYPQLELAKLRELRDTPTIQIIDKAIPAGLRTWPKRGMMCAVTFIISAIMLAILAIIIELFEIKLLESSEFKNRYARFKKELWNRRSQ